MKYIDLLIYTSLIIMISILGFNQWKTPHVPTISTLPLLEPIEASLPEFDQTQMEVFNLPYLNRTGEYLYHPNSPRHKIFILFTPYDCQQCFDEIPFWTLLKNKYGSNFEVIGIISAESRILAKRFTLANKIEIPVIFDEMGIVAGNLGLKNVPELPVKILVDDLGYIQRITPSFKSSVLYWAAYDKYLTDFL